MARTPTQILLVEDDELVARSTQALLERHQIKVVAASDGKEALEFTERFEFDLVLLDLMLPEVNGFQFLRAFRNAGHEDVPVIVVSARTDPVNHFWARRLGAAEYVEKPVAGEHLMEVVDRCLRTRGVETVL